VGAVGTVTADVPASCSDTTSCVPVAGTVKVEAHVQVAGGRVASVKAAAGSGLDPVSEVLYYHRDMQGSVVATTYRTGGWNGYMGARYRYTPYGQLDRVESVSALSDSELGYTGGLRLGYTAGVAQQGNLVLLGARVYHAELKRWLVPDTVDGRRYTYTGGDPVNFVDPSGRMQFPSIGMAEMYYRLFYDFGGTGSQFNIMVGSSGFEGRVANQTYLVGLQAYADGLNSEPPIYLEGTNWRPFGKDNGFLVADLGNTVVSLAEDAGIPLAEFTMDELVVNTGRPLRERPELPGAPVADMIVFSISDRIVTWQDKNGWPAAQYGASTGPHGKGPLQVGRYRASHLQERKKLGMVCGRVISTSVGFSVDLTLLFPTDCDLLRIHSREGFGTLGCIGIVCGDAQRFRDALGNYFGAGGQSTIIVWVLP